MTTYTLNLGMTVTLERSFGDTSAKEHVDEVCFRCMEAVGEGVAWAEAEAECLRAGGHLASADSHDRIKSIEKGSLKHDDTIWF